MRPDGTVAWLALAASARHADGEWVEVPLDAAAGYVGDDALAVAHLEGDGRIVGIRISQAKVPKAPPLWFAELPEEGASPPAVNLLAFTGLDVEPGRLLDREALATTKARTADQLGAVRVYPVTGEVDQIYVSPVHRRENIGTALLYALAVLDRARGWPHLWSDGQRTTEGESWRNVSDWRHRTAELTHLSAPMTPFGEAPSGLARSGRPDEHPDEHPDERPGEHAGDPGE